MGAAPENGQQDRWHRPLEGQIKTLRINKKAGQWYAAFSCLMDDPAPCAPTGENVGIDVGLTHLLTMSSGETVENPHWYRMEQATLRVIQRRIARRTKGGGNRKKAIAQVQRQHEWIANRRKDYLHKLVKQMVRSYDTIALEDLRITTMVKNHHLSKSIMDAGWTYFAAHLISKAESAGRQVCFVDPAYTSKTCAGCGDRFAHEITLAVRWVTCRRCGLSLDRDHNAAINIFKRAQGACGSRPAGTPPLGANVAGVPACVAQEAAPL